MIWEAIWALIKRNILTIVLMITFAVWAFPWSLIFIIPICLVALTPILLLWRVSRVQKEFAKRARAHAEEQNGAFRQESRGKKQEGKVTIIQTEATEQRISDDVGEYVDFKEIKR